ncbi:hypothetical protein FEF34_39190 [Streptomyces marianii]|uniref:Aminoglycoside phosphotransferase domain-containing protein n=1 Tax=Streptomyces marianii TaxID=1817406 RepID=A0A5R9DTH5_9ACTN|nr:hypothetical protein FEF34_39190 [Streptomyces marianii]
MASPRPATSATSPDAVGRIDGRVPDGATEITTGQANRVWYIGGREPYVLKHYRDPARAANEAAALTLLTHHRAPGPRLLDALGGAAGLDRAERRPGRARTRRTVSR